MECFKSSPITLAVWQLLHRVHCFNLQIRIADKKSKGKYNKSNYIIYFQSKIIRAHCILGEMNFLIF